MTHTWTEGSQPEQMKEHLGLMTSFYLSGSWSFATCSLLAHFMHYGLKSRSRTWPELLIPRARFTGFWPRGLQWNEQMIDSQSTIGLMAWTGLGEAGADAVGAVWGWDW